MPGIVAPLLAVIHRLRDAISAAVRPSDKRWPRIAAAWLWLDVVVKQVAGLAARHEAGKLRRGAPRAPAGGRKKPPRSAERRIPLRHPFGWLAREVPETASLIAELEARLADPALQPLLEAAPDRVGRLLRPLCRALGLTPPAPIRRPASRAAAQTAAKTGASGPASPGAVDLDPPHFYWPRRGDPETDALSPKIA